MAAKTPYQILGLPSMLKMVETPFGGVDSSPLPTGLFTLRAPVVGTDAMWFQVPNTRNVAPSNSPGSPARRVAQQALVTRRATCIQAFNQQHHKAHVYQSICAIDDPLRQDAGKSVIDFQVREFNRLHDNLRVSAVCSALFKGHIYFDPNGDLLASSSGNLNDVDYSIPATNIGALSTLTALPNTASWATDGTPILLQLDGFRQLAQQYSGRPIRYILYGKNILTHIRSNTEVIALMQSNRALTEALMSNIIPANFGFSAGDSRGGAANRVDWISAATLGYKDAAGTFQYWCGDDQIVLIPEPDAGWWQFLEGTFPVPTKLGIMGEPNMAEAFRDVRGRFNYCEISTNPSGINHFMGDTFLPAFTDPNAPFIITSVIA